ncbi:MAG TPA: haloacid dehalogenase-like hydrolase [Phycisphaerales bacterium]|nr:haloacid dehalogenase-like hydrolase [Phycisphaerales bacterium]HMP36100.1 haloacid dehalogenase-like hydrolase [Phycisphaerales bacterium]
MNPLCQNLAIFDIDGTLLRTSGVDDECYAAALQERFAIGGISTDWGTYSHSTDGAILDDLIRERLGRPSTDADAELHRSRFVELLERAARQTPERFSPTPGAADAIAGLVRHGWMSAIATGGWRRSALLKLSVAGIDVSDVPAAFADDCRSREGIIETAIRRALAATPEAAAADHLAKPAPMAPRVVYVGDGPWDLRAARRLGIGFVGVGSGDVARRLRAAGAAEVLDRLDPVERLAAALEQAQPEQRGEVHASA